MSLPLGLGLSPPPPLLPDPARTDQKGGTMQTDERTAIYEDLEAVESLAEAILDALATVKAAVATASGPAD